MLRRSSRDGPRRQRRCVPSRSSRGRAAAKGDVRGVAVACDQSGVEELQKVGEPEEALGERIASLPGRMGWNYSSRAEIQDDPCIAACGLTPHR
jgi:hypothetical protein